MATLKELQHEYQATRGLWCIDRNPSEVDYQWIRQNAFQLKDYLANHDEELPNEIVIGQFKLSISKIPGKIWMTNRSGQRAEVDEKVLDDVLKSFF